MLCHVLLLRKQEQDVKCCGLSIPGMGPTGAKPSSGTLLRVDLLRSIVEDYTPSHIFNSIFESLFESLVTILVPRIRTIGVRLSEDEYSALEKFCVESGARSISDLARTAICSFVNRANQESTLVSVVNQHAAQVKELEQKLKRLSADLAIFTANSVEQKTKQAKRRRTP